MAGTFLKAPMQTKRQEILNMLSEKMSKGEAITVQDMVQSHANQITNQDLLQLQVNALYEEKRKERGLPKL
jgi:hypothetical protein